MPRSSDAIKKDTERYTEYLQKSAMGDLIDWAGLCSRIGDSAASSEKLRQEVEFSPHILRQELEFVQLNHTNTMYQKREIGRERPERPNTTSSPLEHVSMRNHQVVNFLEQI